MPDPMLEELREIASGGQNDVPIKAMVRLIIAGVVNLGDNIAITNRRLDATNSKLDQTTSLLIETQKIAEKTKDNVEAIVHLNNNLLVKLGAWVNKYPKRAITFIFVTIILLMFLPTAVVGIAQFLGIPIELVQFVFRIPPSVIP
jgi:hypothetical protein